MILQSGMQQHNIYTDFEALYEQKHSTYNDFEALDAKNTVFTMISKPGMQNT
jgi:hypothetical protein